MENSAQDQYIRDLRFGSDQVRVIAARQLVATPRSGHGERVVNALIEALHDKDDEVRCASVNSLGSVLQQLLNTWKNNADELRKNRSLITAASRATIALLKDRSDDVKAGALRALLAMHLSYQNVPSPGGSVPKPELVGSPPVELRGAILTSLADSDPQVRLLAATLLRSLGPLLSPDLPPELLAAMEDGSPSVREQAAWACSSYKEAFGAVLPDLFARLERAQDPLRSALSQCLEAGTSNVELVPFLRERLKSQSPHVRSAAASLLAKMGPEAAAATPELVALLADPFVPEQGKPPWFERRPDPASRAVRALGRLSPTPQIISGLVANLNSPVLYRRIDAAWALSGMGPAASHMSPGTDYPDAAIAVLIEALQSKDMDSRNYAMMCLGHLGPRAKAAIPLLRHMAAESGLLQFSVRDAIRAIESDTGKLDDARK